MSAIGIIAEFNPFHQGHAYLLETSKKNFPGLPVICVMSGPFTQRGEIAFCHKWSRAEMAVRAGADLVVELPFFYAVRSAYDFARGGLTLLHQLGISHLAFGCESENIPLLQQLAEILAQEPEVYKTLLRQELNRGKGFAAARETALTTCLPESAPEISRLLHAPNAILGLEYLHVLQETGWDVVPCPILRKGAGYHDDSLQALASAKAIRHHIHAAEKGEATWEALQEVLPNASYRLLQEERRFGRCPVASSALNTLILGKLRLMGLESLREIFGMNEGLEYRIEKAALHCGTAEDVVRTVSGKRCPKSRIRRLLLHVLLELTQEKAQSLQSLSEPGYIRVLAASQTGVYHMKQCRKNPPAAPCVFLSSGRELRQFLQQTDTASSLSRQMLTLDLKAASLFSLGYPSASERQGDADFYQQPIFLSPPAG